MERRELTRDSRSVLPRLPVREFSLEASGEEGADERLQVGDAEVAPHHRLQLLSRILKQKKIINSKNSVVDTHWFRILVRICVTKVGF